MIMEHDGAGGSDQVKYEYKLLATNKTSTMQGELILKGENGFELGGEEVCSRTWGPMISSIR